LAFDNKRSRAVLCHDVAVLSGIVPSVMRRSPNDEYVAMTSSRAFWACWSTETEFVAVLEFKWSAEVHVAVVMNASIFVKLSAKPECGSQSTKSFNKWFSIPGCAGLRIREENSLVLTTKGARFAESAPGLGDTWNFTRFFRSIARSVGDWLYQSRIWFALRKCWGCPDKEFSFHGRAWGGTFSFSESSSSVQTMLNDRVFGVVAVVNEGVVAVIFSDGLVGVGAIVPQIE